MIDAARTARRFLAVNLIMRYDPLNQAVARVLEAGLLGAPLHAFFENHAGDTPLGPGHWFWKPEISGGIFIEHGVHFFDLFRMWFGPGEVLAAQQSERPTGGIIDQVHCTVRYGSVLLANFYHGFHQSSRMESQEARIVCERGTIRLFEWVPTRIEIDLLANYADLDTVRSLVPHAEVEEFARTRATSAKFSPATKHFPPRAASASAAAPACRSRNSTAASCARCSPTKSARSRTAASAACLRGKRPDFPRDRSRSRRAGAKSHSSTQRHTLLNFHTT
jgi:predicted dehydrogenase